MPNFKIIAKEPVDDFHVTTVEDQDGRVIHVSQWASMSDEDVIAEAPGFFKAIYPAVH
jgi:hypothetical protein